MGDVVKVVDAAWRRLIRAGNVNFKRADVFRAIPEFSPAGLLGKDQVPNCEPMDCIEFRKVREWFNGEPVEMVHWTYKGVTVNVSLEPPQVVSNQEGNSDGG